MTLFVAQEIWDNSDTTSLRRTAPKTSLLLAAAGIAAMATGAAQAHSCTFTVASEDGWKADRDGRSVPVPGTFRDCMDKT